MRYCKNCIHFTAGVTDRQHKEWSVTNWGRYADGSVIYISLAAMLAENHRTQLTVQAAAFNSRR